MVRPFRLESLAQTRAYKLFASLSKKFSFSLIIKHILRMAVEFRLEKNQANQNNSGAMCRLAVIGIQQPRPQGLRTSTPAFVAMALRPLERGME